MSPQDSWRPHHPDRSVLLVDHAIETRRALAELLRLQGFQVYQATNGRTGLKTLQRHPEIKVIVLDLVMQGSDGLAFRYGQLKDPLTAHIPVIVFTATQNTEWIRVALRTKTVLHKPTAVGDLLTAVAAACDGAVAQ